MPDGRLPLLAKGVRVSPLRDRQAETLKRGERFGAILMDSHAEQRALRALTRDRGQLDETSRAATIDAGGGGLRELGEVVVADDHGELR